MPGRPRLVLHPVRALGQGLADAPPGHRTAPLGASPAGQPGGGADGLLRRVDLRRGRLRRLLLLVPHGDGAVGEAQRHAGGPPGAGLRVTHRRNRGGVRDAPHAFPGAWVRFPPGGPDAPVRRDRIQPRSPERPGDQPLSQLLQAGPFRPTQLRLAGGSPENPDRDGCLDSSHAGGRTVQLNYRPRLV
jgi:hypothetical protein